MKKIYFLFTAVFFFASCAKEVLPPVSAEQQQIPPELESLDFKQIPSEIINGYNPSQLTFLKHSAPFGEINDTVNVTKITTKDGESYTFSLKRTKKQASHKKPAGYYFDNLVVKNGKELKFLIFRYEPTKEWIANGRDVKNFSGTITIFNHLGELQSTLNPNIRIQGETN